MPSPAKRRASQSAEKIKAKPKVAEVTAKALSQGSSSSVQDKIKAWNDKGGGIAGGETRVSAERKKAATPKRAEKKKVVSVVSLSSASTSEFTKESKSEASESSVVSEASAADVLDSEEQDDEDSSSSSEAESEAEESVSSVKPKRKQADPQRKKTEMDKTPKASGAKPNTSSPLMVKRRRKSDAVKASTQPNTPVRPRSSDKERATDPGNQEKHKPKTLEEAIKIASAPKKRVVSDGHWVKRRPVKSSTTKSKAPQLGWSRPAQISRTAHDEERYKIPEKYAVRVDTAELKKNAIDLMMPGKAVYFGKNVESSSSDDEEEDHEEEVDIHFKDFVPEFIMKRWSKREENKKRDAERDERRRMKELKKAALTPSPVAAAVKEWMSEDDEERPIRQNARTQRSAPPTYERNKLRKMSRGEMDEVPPQSPDRPAPLRYKKRPQDYFRASPPAGERDLRDRGDQDDYYMTSPFLRKPSYNAGDMIPVFDELKREDGGMERRPSQIDAWLTATPDPFVSDSTRPPGPGSAKRDFSFTRGPKSESPSSNSRNVSYARETELESRSRSSRDFQLARELQAEARPRSSNREFAFAKRSEEETRPVPRLEQRIERSSPAAVSQRSTPIHHRTTPDHKSDLDSEIEIDYASSSASTPTLRRSGARRNTHSPRTTSPLAISPRDVTTKDDETASSITGSTHTASTASDILPELPVQRQRSTTMVPLRRPFPSTGKRLSTIASVETLTTNHRHTIPTVSEVDSIAESSSEATELARDTLQPLASEQNRDSSKSRDQLLNVSQRTKSVYSSRSKLSVRSKSIRIRKQSAADIMRDLVADEERYLPELRTLVGAVIKLLLSAVINKSEAAVAAGLFRKFGGDDAESEARHAIHEMSVNLERLKTYHGRLPKTDVTAFGIWARGAIRIYREYVRTWRLGFQDVVVHLVPAADDDALSLASSDAKSMANALPRNEEGYVVDEDGHLVDVAFLLKRPLVRLKYICKAVKALDAVDLTGQFEDLVLKYEELMDAARERVNQEKARMEDEAAAQIDTSRARDPTSLGTLSGVQIDPARHVRARDVFDMHLIHSSGQEVLCRVEMLLRDDSSAISGGGDLLVCQADHNGRRLFFPPVTLRNASCRFGSTDRELVLMIRGLKSKGLEWQEVFSVTSTQDGVADDWHDMLGTLPVPPAFTKERLVKEHVLPRMPSSRGSSLLSGSGFTESTEGISDFSPAPTGLSVPIGEKSGPDARKWNATAAMLDGRNGMSGSVTPATPTESELSMRDDYQDHGRSKQLRGGSGQDGTKVRELIDKLQSTANEQALAEDPTLKRTHATTRRRTMSGGSPLEDKVRLPDYMKNDQPRRVSATKRSSQRRHRYDDDRSVSTMSVKGFNVWTPPSDSGLAYGEDEVDDTAFYGSNSNPRVDHKRSTSLPVNQPAPSQSRYVQSRKQDAQSSPPTGRNHMPVRAKSEEPPAAKVLGDSPPPPPPHRTPTTKTSPKSIPQLTPSATSLKRRSSSPLKHEYRPSSASEDSASEGSILSEDSDGALDTEDEDDEDDIALSVIAADRLTRQAQQQPVSLDNSLAPSDSASNAPFRDVPETSTIYLTTVATVSKWNPSSGGNYVSLHSEDCLVEVSPGKVAAYKIWQNFQKKPDTPPVVSLQLLPWTTVQASTVCDLLIKAIPSWDSALQWRPREEDVYIRLHTKYSTHREALQAHVLQAMANNPTHQALERARPPKESEAELFDRQNPGTDGKRKWWGARRANSFRKPHTRGGSTVGNTETENTYRSSASSIRRGLDKILNMAANKGFNVEKSALFSRTHGSNSRRTRSLDGEGLGGLSTAPKDAFSREYPDQLGNTLRSAQCRLISLEKSKHASNVPKDKGRVTLHVLHATRNLETGSVTGLTGPDGIHDGNGLRIVLSGMDTILVDRVVPPSCFSQNTKGIAMHLFMQKESDGTVSRTGGVGTLVSSVLFLSDFESESMREWIFTTLTGQKIATA